MAMLSAAALTVAAIGDLPLAVCVPAGRSRLERWGFAWAFERSAWPLVGAMLGMLAAGDRAGSWPIGGEMVAGSLLATATVAGGRFSGASAADAGSLALVLAAASEAAGLGLAPRLGGGFGGAVAAWLLLGTLTWAWSRSQVSAIDVLGTGQQRAGHVATADVLHVDALPANGPLRQALTRLAMVTALAAMAGWLMLEPAVSPAAGAWHDQADQHGSVDRLAQVHRAALAWALFTAAWFVGLVVPQATLQDGIAGAARWERLLRTAAGTVGGPAPSRRHVWKLRPGPVRFAGGVALSQAAILGWPVLVCAALSWPMPDVAQLPLSIVVGLATALAAVTAGVAIGTAVHASRETTFAVMLAIVVGCVAITAGVAASGRWLAQSAPPSPPTLADPLLQRLRGG